MNHKDIDALVALMKTHKKEVACAFLKTFDGEAGARLYQAAKNEVTRQGAPGLAEIFS